MRVLCVLLLVSCAHGGPPAAVADVPLGQLPQDVVPLRYNLTLTVDPRQPGFTGEERIAVRVNAPVDSLWLHGRDLAVSSATFSAPGTSDVAATYEQVHADGIARVRFPGPLPVGEGTLSFRWSAAFDTHAAGLYRVHDGDNDYAFTQFESQDARKAFPCFDEPGFKTPFDVTLVIPRDEQAVANTAVASTSDTGQTRTLHFDPTVPLPTYLVALAVGPLDIVEAPPIPPNEVRATPLPLRGIAARGKGPLLAYALQRVGAFVTLQERYFGVAYPFEKLDVAAVPDFAPGAMENAGLITFREFLLLVDDKTAPLTQKRAFAGVTMHELAHQWFGDLVTLRWWDDIWLNEAFATWMGDRSVDAWDPEQKATLDQLLAAQGTMGQDRLASARAIRQPILTRNDVENAFDGITYVKGAAVIGMFEHWVGAEAFRAGIHSYLEAHRFANGSADDFLAAISQAAHVDVSKPFHSFLDQAGVPILDVRLACDRDVPAAELSTKRYAPLGSTVDPNVLWQVPVCLAYEAEGQRREQCTLLTSATQTVSLETKTCPRWVLPNADARGYFTFSLPPELLAQLVADAPKLNERERLALGHSVQAATDAGRLPYSVGLTSLMSLARAGDWRLEALVIGALRFARDRLAPDELRPAVARLARDAAVPPPRRAAPSQDDQLQLRSALTLAMDIGRDPYLRADALQAAERFLAASPAQPPSTSLFGQPSFLDLTLNVAAEDGSGALIASMIARARTSSVPILRAQLLRSVGNTLGAQSTLPRQLIFDPWVRPSEVGMLLGPQATKPETREATWPWFTAHYDEIAHRLPEGARGGLPGLFGGFCSEERASELQAFFQPRLAEAVGGPRNLAHATEEIRLCAAQVQAHRASLAAWLASRPTPAAQTHLQQDTWQQWLE